MCKKIKLHINSFIKNYFSRNITIFTKNSDNKNEWTMSTGTGLLTPIGSELLKICD